MNRYMQPLFRDGHKMIFAIRNKIVSIDESGNKENIISLPVSWFKNILLRSRLVNRILRLDVFRATQHGEYYFFCFQGRLFSYNKSSKILKKELLFEKGNGPLIFCNLMGVSGFDDGLYFGEYFSDIELDRIRILKRTDSGEWHACFTFQEGRINHIHALVPDKSNDCVWILTGDFGEAAAIYRATNNFKNVEPIVKGSQKYRACVAFPLKDNLVYATDTPYEKNHIRKLYKTNSGSWLSKKLYEVNGPIVYGCETKDYYIFSSTVEPGHIKPNFFLNLLDRKRGIGILRNQVEIYSLKKSDNTLKLIDINPKDQLPARLFQFGSASLSGHSTKTNRFYAYYVGTEFHEGNFKQFDINHGTMHD